MFHIPPSTSSPPVLAVQVFSGWLSLIWIFPLQRIWFWSVQLEFVNSDFCASSGHLTHVSNLKIKTMDAFVYGD